MCVYETHDCEQIQGNLGKCFLRGRGTYTKSESWCREKITNVLYANRRTVYSDIRLVCAKQMCRLSKRDYTFQISGLHVVTYHLQDFAHFLKTQSFTDFLFIYKINTLAQQTWQSTPLILALGSRGRNKSKEIMSSRPI